MSDKDWFGLGAWVNYYQLSMHQLAHVFRRLRVCFGEMLGDADPGDSDYVGIGYFLKSKS